MADTIRYIIEALRNKPTAPGIYRESGRPVRRQGGTIQGSVKSTSDDVNYHRYVKMQNDMGESPVSYEEWMRK